MAMNLRGGTNTHFNTIINTQRQKRNWQQTDKSMQVTSF